PNESIYVLEDELVITISFYDAKTIKSLPNEWVYALKKSEIEDVMLKNSTLILSTKDKKQVRITLFRAEKAFLMIKEWMKK
ncbi:MAG: hypothetical protein QXV57_01975, partial [Thermoproteota archaeon]